MTTSSVDRIWKDLELKMDTSICLQVLADIASDVECIRTSVSVALSELLRKDKGQMSVVLQRSMEMYQEKLYVCNYILGGQ